MPDKPQFNPNAPYKEVNENLSSAKKPAFDSSKPFNPISSELRAGDPNITQPTYTNPIDRQVDSAIDFIKQKGGRNGSTIMDSELDVLKDVLKDPRATQEQRKNAILTIQGYDSKHNDDNTMYYNKREANGVYMPTALAYGEKPPQGYHTASVWGNQKEANNDPWYLDLGKSLANGVIGAAQSVVDVAQIGTALVTGEESKYLNKLSNTADALKFEKDKDLNAPIFNTEGITKFADLADKDRFDFSPKALWGTLNMATESIVPFLGIAGGTANLIKGGKGLVQGLKGVDAAIDLSNAAQKATIFAGSFATQVGDVYDVSKEAGLSPRDAAGLSTAIGAVMAGFDLKYGIDAKIMSQFYQNEKRNIFKTIISKVERDAVTGEITPLAFKKLVKETSIGYGELAKNGIKEVVKDALEEGGQEAAQDFTQKAGEQLWDKMSSEEKAKFGTDAFDAKSFGSYLNSLSTGIISGTPMSVGVQVLKNKHDEQSLNAYNRVKQGPEAVSALKADLATSVKNGDITPEEHDQAIFKIDAYSKYHEETKGVNLQPVDEKKAFELSFQIQGLKTEIPTNENEISKLDPISRSKVESKQKQAKELQSELNDIIRNGEIKGEPVVPKKEEERIIKEREKESKLKESHKTAKENRWEELIDNSVSEKELDAVLGQMDNSNQTTPDLIDYVGLKRAEFIKDKEKSNSKLKQKESAKEPNPDFPIEPKVEAKLEKAWITDKRTYNEVPAEEFNHSKTDERLIHKITRKHIWEQPEHEVNGQLYLHQYEYNGKKNRTIRVKLEDGKILKLGSSKVIDESGLSGYFHTERLKGNLTNEPVGVKVVELAPDENGVKKKVIKIYQKSSGKYLAYIKETHTGQKNATDKNGNPLYSQEQIKGELEDIKLQDEDPLLPEEVERLRNTPIVPIIPKTNTEKAKVATDKIIEEGKSKVESARLTNKVSKTEKVDTTSEKLSEKSYIPLTITKAVKQQLYDLGFSKVSVDSIKPERANEIINKQGKEISDSDTVDNLVDSRVEYNGEIGFIRKDDGGKLTFETNDKIVELNNTDIAKEINAEDVKYNNGKVSIGKEIYEYISTNENKDGDVVSVTLKNSNTKTITIRNLDTALSIDRAKSNSENKSIDITLNESEENEVVYVTVKKEFGVKAISYIENMPDEVADAFIELESGTTTLDAEELQLIILNANEWADKAINEVSNSNSSKSEKKDVVYMLNKFKKDLNKYYNGIEKQKNKSGIFAFKQAEPKQSGEGSNKKEIKQEKQIEDGKQESAVNGEKPATGSAEEANGEDGKPHKGTVKKGGVKAILRKPKEINRVNAGKIAPDTVYHDVIKYFIDGGRISKEAVRVFYKGSIGEVKAKNNITYSELKYDKKYAPSLDGLAHALWQSAPKVLGEVTTEEYKDALEAVLLKYDSPIEMAKDYIKALGEKERVAPSEAEQVVIEAYDKLNEELGYKLDIAIDYFEGKTDEELKAIAEKDKWEEGTDIITNESEGEPFQKVSQRKGDYSKVAEVIQKAFNKDNIKVIVDESKFTGVQSTVAGKLSADGKNIYLNPNYAGLDTPIHEGGHVLIDAMGYDNKVIQSAIKQLRNTPLYAETKVSYPELSEQELDKEVLAEAIGREGADIFDNVNDKSKFKQYLDYIFDWFKRKLGIEKNVAKSLAKQIISGVGTKGLKGTETGKEQLSKKTKEKNPIGPRPLNFQQYAAENGFSYEKETEKIEEAKVNLTEAKENEQEALVNGTEEEYDKASKELKDAKKAYSIAGKKTFEYKQYKEDFATIQEILKAKDLESYTTEELQDLIAKTHGFSDKASKTIKREAMLKLSYAVRKEQIDFLNDNNASYIESIADKKDIGALDVKLLNLSHFKEHQPEMQAGAKIIGNAFMDRIADANTRKDIHEKLAVKVIQEENKKLGIVGAVANRFSSDSAKYFDWMDKNGELLTVKGAEDMGLSQAKINYLKFTRETISDFNDEMTANDFENIIMDSIKVDKGFKEAFKSEGFVTAFSYYLGGGGANLGKVRIMHNGKPMAYSEIEKDIISKVKKNDVLGIIKALYNLLVANVSARRQLKRGFNVDEKENPLEMKGMAEYSLNSKGQLVSKFDKPRSKDRGYSKDFYRAMNQFIDESAHVKHMSKIMPLVESLEYLNANGYTEKGIAMKPNVEEWIKQWKALHIFKEPYVNDPILDASIKFMRKLVSLTTMAFNIPANTINVAVGNYNSWRQENAKTLAIGNKRLFLTKGERAGLGTVSKYALDIIKKYNVVNQDYDSQPTMRAGTIFSRLANIGTQVGEYQIQGSLGLGLLSEDEFNSFEYTKDKYGNEILTLKPNSKFSEADIKTKMLSIKNRVTDIQGKYPDEDRRNIMRGEIGKAAFQFKVWMPDWFKERFGAKYINAFGVEKEGSIHALYGEGFKQIYADLKKGNFKELSNNKKFMSNFKGLLAIGTLLALTHKDDDDEEVRGKVSTAQNLIGQILFIMDPEQVKYTVSNPIAVLGKAKDAISAIQAIATLDEKAFEKSKRVIPAFSKLEKDYDLVKNLIE